MNIVVLQENLLRELSVVSRFLPTKSTTIPVLNNFLLRARDGIITVSTSNIETTITTTLSGKVETEGSILLPGKTVLSLLPTLSGEKIKISTDGKNVLLVGEKARVTLRSENPEEFPSASFGEEKNEQEIPADFIRHVVQKVSFAASLDPARAILTSILLSSEGKKLSAVATDGFRLAKFETMSEKTAPFPPTALPAKVVEALPAILKDKNNEKIRISFIGENQVSFSFSGVKLITQVVGGAFPDYNRIIPKETSIKITMGKEDIARAVKFASILAREASNIIKLKTEQGSLRVSANAPQVGENVITIPVKKEGEDVEVAFNYRFLLDFFAAGDGDEIVFETSGSLSPGVFRFTKSPGYFYIAMPVRLQDA